MQKMALSIWLKYDFAHYEEKTIERKKIEKIFNNNKEAEKIKNIIYNY